MRLYENAVLAKDCKAYVLDNKAAEAMTANDRRILETQKAQQLEWDRKIREERTNRLMDMGLSREAATEIRSGFDLDVVQDLISVLQKHGHFSPKEQ
jgi:hypothetical protein